MRANEGVVLVDMDGVIADFEVPNNDIIRTHFPHIEPVIDRTDFYYKDTYRDYEGVNDVIYRENRRPGFFMSFPLVDGVIDGLERILNAGFSWRVCSSPLTDHITVIAEKKEYLEEYIVPYFGAWVLDEAIFDRDKSSYDAVAMIDDRPTLRNVKRARWQHVMFTQSYNKPIETNFRLQDWHDPSLENLLVKAKEKYLHKRQ